MAIDPQVIRSERFDEIATTLERGAGVILDRWCRRAAADQPNARHVHREILRDELPAFLLAMSRSLAETGEAETRQHQAPARRHGAQRWENGWSLPEVVQDYQLLRLIILEYLEEALDRPLVCREVMAVGLMPDDATAASVERYVAGREEAVRGHTEALKEAHRRKDEFLAILAHELRNPLGSILNSVEVLRLAGSGESAVVEARDVVERQVRQMARLVDDLLDVARLSLGKMELRRRRIDVATAVAEAVQTSSPLIEARQHTLTVELFDEPLWLDADPDRLVQIIVNLLTNAAKYTEPGGQIKLACEREGDEAVLRVRDSGIGIPPAMLARIFELFTQLDPSPERSRGGLGIGLKLVRRLAEMHGGRVSVSSEGPGRGSEFVVRLPLTAPPQAAPSTGPTEPVQTTASRHVLIVEDDPDGRETLKKLLELAGHRVETAENGQAGVASAVSLRPQVALIDIGLPDLNGYEVARQIRAAFGQNTVYLIALTGFSPENGGNGDEDKAVFDAHLTKPVDLRALTHLLNSLPVKG